MSEISAAGKRLVLGEAGGYLGFRSEEKFLVVVAGRNVFSCMRDQVYSRSSLILNMVRFLGERCWRGKYHNISG